MNSQQTLELTKRIFVKINIVFAGHHFLQAEMNKVELRDEINRLINEAVADENRGKKK